ncbi:MAG TPA: hypothetical protein VFX47_07355, partial [Gammaproteobacteria bacterium]|nr:hypothetical protein [Gammaproteobacteria bacterium]
SPILTARLLSSCLAARIPRVMEKTQAGDIKPARPVPDRRLQLQLQLPTGRPPVARPARMLALLGECVNGFSTHIHEFPVSRVDRQTFADSRTGSCFAKGG